MMGIKDFLPKLDFEKLNLTKLIWECPICSSENTLVAEVQACYLKVLNTPFIPRGKKLNVHCSNCTYQSDLETLPEALKQVCTRILKNSKKPISHYRLLIYTGILISVLLYWIYLQEPSLIKYLKDPKTGDIYLISTGISLKGYAMVTGVEKNYIYLTTFKEKPDSIYNIARKNKYVEIRAVFTPYSREQLYNLYEEGIILYVERSDLPEGVKIYENKVIDFNNERKSVPPTRSPNKTEAKRASPTGGHTY